MRNGFVPDCGLVCASNTGTRSSDTYKPCSVKATSAGIRTKLNDSLFSHGVLLFNSLPITLRMFNRTPTEFKIHLDRFLKKIPDQPQVPGLTPEAKDINGPPSNCLIDWIRELNPVCDLNDDSDLFYDFS